MPFFLKLTIKIFMLRSWQCKYYNRFWSLLIEKRPQSNFKDVPLVDKGIMHDEEEEEKRVAPLVVAGVVSAGAATVSALTDVVKAMGNINRKIAIGIRNEAHRPFEALNVYYLSGTSDNTLPQSSIAHGKALVYTARKTSGSARGAVGVMSIYLPNDRVTLCVLFSVPYDYNLYSNWWNAKFYSGKKSASYDIYEDLYYNQNPFKGDDGFHSRSFSVPRGCKIRGYMNSSGTSTLQVTVTC